MATDQEINAGIAALKAYVEQAEGWEAEFVPDEAYTSGATDVITAADSAMDQSDESRQDAGIAALRAAIDATGYGGDVSDAQCAAGAAAVLAAVATFRTPQT